MKSLRVLAVDKFRIPQNDIDKLQSAFPDCKIHKSLASEDRAEIVNGLGMRLRLIPAGEFLMGTPDSDINRLLETFSDLKREYVEDERPQHRVRIRRPLYMGVHEVTVGQFRQFVTAEGYKTEAERDGEGGYGWNESTGKFEGRDTKYSWRETGFSQDDNHPVVNVSWNDAVAFCKWLSGKEGRTYRLPTEAEWEYACRAGTTSWYWFGNDPQDLARHGNVADATAKAKLRNYRDWTYIERSDGHVFTSPVGRFRPNPWGLYDMHGNVWELCADGYASDYYGTAPLDDPQGSSEASNRVSRGGSWFNDARNCRSANRDRDSPDDRNADLGFRVVAVQSAGRGPAGH